MLQNATKYMQMLANSIKYFQMLPKCYQLHPHASKCCKCFQMLANATKYSQMIPNATTYCQIIPNDPIPNAAKCSHHMLAKAPKCFPPAPVYHICFTYFTYLLMGYIHMQIFKKRKCFQTLSNTPNAVNGFQMPPHASMLPSATKYLQMLANGIKYSPTHRDERVEHLSYLPTYLPP